MAVEMIDRCTGEQSRLVDDLLDSSRIIYGKLRVDKHPMDFTTVVSHALEAAGPAAAPRTVVAQLANESPLLINGDPALLQRAVANLLNNAIKFTPETGRIEIRLQRDAQLARLEVADDGIGISQELLPKLFHRFVQANNGKADNGKAGRRAGLGLGLSIVRHLVECHDGSVSARSDGAGHGSTFTMTLPLVTSDIPAEKKEAPDVGSAGGLRGEG
jgi:signal transduction histidine kinase